MTITAVQIDAKLQELECVLLFISLIFPPIIFIPNIFLTPEKYKTPELFYSISTMLSLCSILLFLPVAIFNSFVKLQHTDDRSFREIAAARITLLLILFTALIISSFYIMPLTEGSFDPESTEWAPRTVFLVYVVLLVYFLFVHLNKVSRWLKERLHFLISFNIFLFIFSWVFWSIGFGYLDERMWQERYDGMERWEGVSELANDIRDFNLLERYLERVFPKNVVLKVPENSILLRSVPLEDKSGDKKVRIYFLDDRGFEMVEAFYTYKGGEVWEFAQASDIKLLKVD